MPIDPFAVARQLDERDARIAELEAERERLEAKCAEKDAALGNLCMAVETHAYQIPAPNPFTPVFIQMVVGARRTLSGDGSAHHIATAFREARAQAFREAAGIVEDHIEGFYDPTSPKGYANHRLVTAASNIRLAAAIERAAKEGDKST